MSDTPSNLTLDQLIANYLQSVERGEEPDRELWLANHPNHAEGLRAFLDDNSRIKSQVDAAEIELPATTIDGQGLPTGNSPRIGNYKLLQQLGTGGMGEVWMAEQEKPVKRRVAIKLIKAGMDSKAVLARFDAERQALALMSHPNIAKVFDAGIISTEDQAAGVGRPYFAMELVRGIPITEYCDSRRLEIRERLKLFRQCCSAVHHAHQKGIIHRDLKPSNVLVENHDDEPVLKVIDFGLAKAIGGTQLTEQTLFTAMGTVAGTPLYMAPEQAVLNALDIDIRADVFSLGVLLYELMTGTTPLISESFKEKGLDELLKLIREYEPPSPSQRVSSSETLANIAALRQIEPKRLGRFVRGELDWISMKALAKERERRYGSALALSEDIGRYLNEEPVQASPPSTAYKLRKFATKNKGLVRTLAAIAVAMLLGILGTTWGLLEATEATATAVAAKESAERERDEKVEALKLVASERAAAEKHLAASIIRPIGNYTYDPDINTGNGRLRQVELDSLAQWATLDDKRLRVRILEVGLEVPESAEFLANRTDLVIKAVVGTDPVQRKRVADLLFRLSEDDRYAIQFAVLRFATALGTASVEQVASLIRDPSLDLYRFREDVFAPFVSHGLLPSDAVILWDALDSRSEAEMKDWEYREVALAMNALVTFLPKESADSFFVSLVDVYATCENAWRLGMNSEWHAGPSQNGLVALARRMSKSQIEATVQFAQQQLDEKRLIAAAHAITGLVHVVENDRIIWAWRTIYELRVEETFEGSVGSALEILASRVSDSSIPNAVEAMLANSDLESPEEFLQWELVGPLRELSPRLDATSASLILETVLRVAEQTQRREDLEHVCWILELLSKVLNEDDMTKSFNKLVELSELRWRDFGLEHAASAIAAYGPRLDRDQIPVAWRAIIAQGETANDLDNGLEAARDSLSTLSPLIPDSEVNKCLNLALDLFDDETTREFACAAVGAIAPRLDQDQLAKAWEHLAPRVTHDSLIWNRRDLDAVAFQMDSSLSAAVFDELCVQLSSQGFPDRTETIETQLIALTPRIDLDRAKTAFNFLSSLAITDFNSTEMRVRAVKGISVIAETHDEDERITLLSRLVGNSLGIDVLSRFVESQDVGSAPGNLFPLLERMWENSRGRYGVEQRIAEILVLMTPHLNLDQREDAFGLLSQLISDSEDRDSGDILADAILGLKSLLRSSQFKSLTAMFVEKDLQYRIAHRIHWLGSQHYSQKAIARLLIHVEDPTELLVWLRKPGATGNLGDCLLARLEELVLYRGESVFTAFASQVPTAEWNQLDSESQFEWLAKEEALPKRQFPTLWHAIEWLAANRPDLDLESPFVPEDYQLPP
ncbi:MAG: serine/threonine protein kinase [Planctomycetales bacterium]|nr:serine/threonine protein kinase [Planctomycetales bacterium]